MLAIVCGLVLLSVTVGGLVVRQPLVGLALAGVTLFPALLTVDRQWVIIAAVSAALLSRVLILFGLSAMIAYSHFAIALIGLVILLIPSRPINDRCDNGDHFQKGFILFTVAVIASAWVNGWVVLRPLILWLTLVEPFIILRLGRDFTSQQRSSVFRAIIILALAQLPFGLYQYVMIGFSDPVQGTLIGLGSGAHTAAAITLSTGLLLLVIPPHPKYRSMVLLPAIALLSFGIFSDAKQVYGAAAIAAIPFFLASIGSRRIFQLAFVGVMGVGAIWVASLYHPGFSQLMTRDRIDGFYSAKFDAWGFIISQLGWARVLLGAGPGLGASRVAFLNIDGTYGNVPVSLVGSGNSPIASEIFWRSAALQSSAGSAVSSVLGIFADLGVLGLIGYGLLTIYTWRFCDRLDPSVRRLGRYLLALALVLGFIFAWLDEPAYVVFLAALLVALPRQSDSESPSTADDLLRSAN